MSSDSTTRNGKVCILIDSHGYSYLPPSVRDIDDKPNWRCSSHKDQCRVMVRQEVDEIFRRNTEIIHNHEPNSTTILNAIQDDSDKVIGESHEFNCDSKYFRKGIFIF